MHIIIKQLTQCSQYSPILAHWSYLEWYKHRNLDFDIILKSYQKNIDNQQTPIRFVAIADSLPVAMATLKDNDLWSRKDLNPWLSSLYVVPDFRNKGIAEKLISEILLRSGELNYNRIYLFLGQNKQEHLETYYTKRNWKFLDDAVDNDGLPTRIFYYDLQQNL